MKFLRFIAILVLGLLPAPRLHAELVDGILAVVNDTAITRQQVEDIVEPALETLQRQYAGQPESVYEQKVSAAMDDGLEQLVERQLILHDFDAQGYRMPDSYLEQLVQQEIRDRYTDRVTLMKSLQQEGETFEQFRERIRDRTIETFMRSKNVAQEIVISPFAIQNYYKAHPDDFKVEDEVKLRMIVLNKAGSDDTNTVALAREIHDKIKGGASFAEMATIYSQDSLRNQGGDRGWIGQSVLRPELAGPAFALAIGQVSDVVETPDACYLMLVEDKHAAHVKSLDEVRNEIENNLRAQEHARLEKQWIAKLKAKTFILYF